MKKYFPVLKHTQLFSGIGEEEIASMLDCMGASLKAFTKGEYIFRQGERISDIAILTEGRIHIRQDDYWGNSNIISTIGAGEIFGEAYLAPDSGAMANDVVAAEDAAVIFINAERIITACPSACRFHSTVIQNLFFSISDKNRRLVQKLEHMSKRTTREKLMSYLSQEAKRQTGTTFTIPFNRQQLADYLSVDRSAMSNELCKMRDEGLIKFEKNRFTLI